MYFYPVRFLQFSNRQITFDIARLNVQQYTGSPNSMDQSSPGGGTFQNKKISSYIHGWGNV